MISDTLKEAEQKMDKAVSVTREDFASIRTGRANPSMFHKLTADYYGTPTPLQQLASFTVPEARVIIISPYDQSAMSGIEKAIRDSDLGVNPTDDGKTIRVVLPELTEDRRKDLVKKAHDMAEHARTGVRQARRDGNDRLKAMEKKHEVSQDDERRGLEEIQKLHDHYIADIAHALQVKEKDILTL